MGEMKLFPAINIAIRLQASNGSHKIGEKPGLGPIVS